MPECAKSDMHESNLLSKTAGFCEKSRLVSFEQYEQRRSQRYYVLAVNSIFSRINKMSSLLYSESFNSLDRYRYECQAGSNASVSLTASLAVFESVKR